jgi:hypothetical protein
MINSSVSALVRPIARIPRPCRLHRNAGAVMALALGIASCDRMEHTVTLDAYPSRTIAVSSGQELDLIIGTIGGGLWQNPPSISTPVVQFRGFVADVPPNNPGGPTELFRFDAVAHGRAVIVFTLSPPCVGDGCVNTIADTVDVR